MNFEVIPDEQTPETPQIKDVPKFIEKHKKEIEAFKEYAISRKDGVGLAANQCSLDEKRFNLRMVAIKKSGTDDCRIAIDPKIVKYYGIKLLKYEGCLTWKGKAGMTVKAHRYYYVDVEFYTPDGKLHKETHKGFQSQVWQHETNHINGIKENIVVLLQNPPNEKFGRNDQCPCGSGIKLKHYCIKD